MLDYDRFACQEIRRSHDHYGLVGQENIRRYRAFSHLRIRIHENDSPSDILAMASAAIAVGSRVTLSHDEGIHEETVAVLEELTDDWAGNIEFVEESSARLIKAIQRNQIDRLRFAHPSHVPVDIQRAANEAQLYIVDSPVCPIGRIELLRYVEEQSISFDYHRYGNLSSYTGGPFPRNTK
jgi:RHH-type proline utilization regulon transcriptional repressor/proline dehydrogenase/delta 1-pyrroline-5-carboxylate dehydrogenase